MRKHLPYKEMDQNFNDLPLPDEEASWQKMKELLDRDEKDKRRVLPLFFRTLAGWAILILVGVTVVWLSVRPEKMRSEVNKIKEASSSSDRTPQDENRKINPRNDANVPSKSNDAETKTVGISKEDRVDGIIESREVNETQKKISRGLAGKKNHVDQPQPLESISGIDHLSPDGKTRRNNLTTSPNSMKSNFSRPTTAPPAQRVISTATYELSQRNNLADRKQTSQQYSKLFVTVGLGLQQQIPIAGQAVVPYSYYGTKGSLPDYLPHIYVQLQKEKRWFVEADFRFGVAQAVQEFSYSQQTTYDTASMNLTVTTMRLKKTYYHELSSSFSYFLVPNFSVGAGGMYSRFHGAVTEQETNTSNILTQAKNSVKEIIPVKHFTDSFLYKNQLRVLMQVGYQWRKFSFSLRYTKDIQPYIKYTRPDGTVTDEKNQSLQFLLRYKLWQSRRF